MKTGADIGTPIAREVRKWPISWTKMISTSPTAKAQPKTSE